MKKFIRYINNEVLVKSANLNTANISLKILAGILISKFIAVYIGPHGMALIGNLRNFLSVIQSFAISGLYKGLVNSINEFKDDLIKLTKLISTVFYFGFFSTILLSLLCYYNADTINEFLFTSNYNYTYVIETLAMVLPFYVLNMFVFSIINGFAKYKLLLIINILGQILGLLVTLILIYQENINGALMSIVITPALNVLITFVGIAFRKSYVSAIRISKINLSVLNKLKPEMIIALVGAIAIPIVMILIRNYIISEIGIKAAGYWTAMTRVSDYYLMFFNSLMALYILPRFSEINSKIEFRKEVFGFYKTIMPVFLVILLLIFLSRSLLINLLFTEEFRPVEDLFGYQILGDIMRVLSMVIAYQFLAKKMFAHFVILSVFLFVMMYFSSIYLIDEFGVKGAVMGHFMSYLMYFGIIVLTFSSSLFGVLNEDKID
ncbi:PST family polysaccharide transporter [Winogradskyella epiphytica]|uniref:PST family polysaccharide transporter n=1 Tax=Winogradskyella epiphytica TaxID=262005 RepID=A0A2V4XCA9_9FLAO|nr:O-antigen translocase [Winogradskyella epiphytica]PYE80121.1 PST family polysaccharide transporter [Winogradskyella epiphytica]GGW71565.1 LPS biosynthesis protein [Winogradskyella epiphytica]